MLDAYDSPATREIIKAAITSILAELCGNVEDVSASLKEYIEGNLTPNLDKVGVVISRGVIRKHQMAEDPTPDPDPSL